MSAMANRTVLVDNNTWNNTHIATGTYLFLLIFMYLCVRCIISDYESSFNCFISFVNVTL